MDSRAARILRRPVSLPKEHGFWVLLTASLSGSIARTHAEASALAAAVLVAFACVLGAAVMRRYVRSASWAQLAGAVTLAFAGVPVEVLAGVAPATIAAGAAVKAVVFGSSVLLVRAALTGSSKHGARKSAAMYLTAYVLSLASLVAFGLALRVPEAIACALVAISVSVLAWHRPSAKDLKPLGLCMTGLALLATLTQVL